MTIAVNFHIHPPNSTSTSCPFHGSSAIDKELKNNYKAKQNPDMLDLNVKLHGGGFEVSRPPKKCSNFKQFYWENWHQWQ